jgi:hypothetical protein
MDPLASRVVARFADRTAAGSVTEKVLHIPKDAAWKHASDGLSTLERLLTEVQKEVRGYASAPAFRRAEGSLDRALQDLAQAKAKLEDAEHSIKAAIDEMV